MSDQAIDEGFSGPTIIDTARPPEVFTEGAIGFVLVNGNLHVTLTALRAGYRSNPSQGTGLWSAALFCPFLALKEWRQACTTFSSMVSAFASAILASG